MCGPEPAGQPVTGCNPSRFSTSYRNQFYGNVTGLAPAGQVQPNGRDFWWDSFAGNTGNCWYDNRAAPGLELRNQPASLPDCDGGRNPAESTGTGDLGNEAELLACFGALTTGSREEPCPWFTTPPKPGTRAAALGGRRSAVRRRRGVDNRPRAATPSPTAFPPTLQTADCGQWRELRPASRRALVEQMTRFFGARVDAQYGRGQTLPPERAVAVLTDGCRPAYAGAVKLYKLYGRAAAFTPAG